MCGVVRATAPRAAVLCRGMLLADQFILKFWLKTEGPFTTEECAEQCHQQTDCSGFEAKATNKSADPPHCLLWLDNACHSIYGTPPGMSLPGPCLGICTDLRATALACRGSYTVRHGWDVAAEGDPPIKQIMSKDGSARDCCTKCSVLWGQGGLFSRLFTVLTIFTPLNGGTRRLCRCVPSGGFHDLGRCTVSHGAVSGNVYDSVA